jgi:hypothetical protein
MNPVLWIDFTKQMHMIGHALQFQNRCLMFRGYFTKDGFQLSGYLVDQHFPSVLRTPNNMLFARIDNITIAFEAMLITRTHVLIIR